MAKDKYLRFLNQKKEYLRRFTAWDSGYEVKDPSEEDLTMKALLEGLDQNLFYDHKILMNRFKKRYANFRPEYKKKE